MRGKRRMAPISALLDAKAEAPPERIECAEKCVSLKSHDFDTHLMDGGYNTIKSSGAGNHPLPSPADISVS